MTPPPASDQQPRGRAGLPVHLSALLRPRPPHHVQDQAAEPRADDGGCFGLLSVHGVNLDTAGAYILHTRGAECATAEDTALHRGELEIGMVNCCSALVIHSRSTCNISNTQNENMTI